MQIIADTELIYIGERGLMGHYEYKGVRVFHNLYGRNDFFYLPDEQVETPAIFLDVNEIIKYIDINQPCRA